MGLLTVTDVATLLNISKTTVYDQKNRLGGFYPAGIRVLRFRPEVINGILQGDDLWKIPDRQEIKIIRSPISRFDQGDPNRHGLFGDSDPHGLLRGHKVGLFANTDPNHHGL